MSQGLPLLVRGREGASFSLTLKCQLLSLPGNSEFLGVGVYFESGFNMLIVFVVKIIENKIHF